MTAGPRHEGALVRLLCRLDRERRELTRELLEADYWDLVDQAARVSPGVLNRARDAYARLMRREAGHARHDD